MPPLFVLRQQHSQYQFSPDSRPSHVKTDQPHVLEVICGCDPLVRHQAGHVGVPTGGRRLAMPWGGGRRLDTPWGNGTIRTAVVLRAGEKVYMILGRQTENSLSSTIVFNMYTYVTV